MLDRLADPNTGLIDFTILEMIAENLAKEYRQKLLSGDPVFDTTTGAIDKISETLNSDPGAKETLLNAIDENGQIDFSKIDSQDLDKFRDPITGEIDLQKLE